MDSCLSDDLINLYARRKRAYFVDLFVRVSNKVAINMYTNLGYIVYRTVLEYYAGDVDEDAYGNIERIAQKSIRMQSQELISIISTTFCRYEESIVARCG